MVALTFDTEESQFHYVRTHVKTQAGMFLS